jgi:predicted membrane channel-forming protein YqfA (hemolysin III family)
MIQDFLNIVPASFQALFSAPTWFLLLIVLNLVGVWLQKSEWFPNKLIPVVLCLLGVGLLMFFAFPEDFKISPTAKHREGIVGVIGFLLGAIAYGLHGALLVVFLIWRKRLLDRVRKILPNNTEFFGKDETKTKPEDPAQPKE